MATAKKGSSKKKGNTAQGTSGKEPEPKARAEESTPDIGIPGFSDNIRLGAAGNSLFIKAAITSVGALALGAVLGMMQNDGFRHFLHSYLVAYMVALAVGAGAVFWVTLQNLVNAHWSIVLRRVAESFASGAIPVLFVLALPIIVPTVLGSDVLYEWADKAKVEADHVLQHKASYLNPNFFLIRMVVYFGFWAFVSRFFWSNSVAQDQAADGEKLRQRMRLPSGPMMIFFALALTFCAIDFLMSLDPHWFSTIFGVYFFASCVQCIHITLALSAMWLQSKNRLAKSVTIEHYHDVGKMLFAFTIFWAYIGFSQFMLIWYANLPEETLWFKHRFVGGWGNVAWMLLFGHFVIPFFGLLSRHIKRNKKTLAFWALWQLAMVYLDMYWLVMPELSSEGPPFHPMDLLCLIGTLSAVIAAAAYRARDVNLIPIKDPRLERSLAFENL